MKLYTIILAVVIAGCQSAPREVVIFHTNDIHGHFTAEPASWREDKALVGGFAALSGYLTTLRNQHPNSIYLDAGDLMTGNPICNIEFNGVKGGALLELLKRVELDAMCLGNHEFDIAPDHVRKFATSASFPILSANIIERESSKLICEPAKIIKCGKVRIGVIGLILQNLTDVVAKKNVEPFQVLDISETAQQYIDELDPNCDLIVLLTHNGVIPDSILATQIHGADIIVGGHSHTRLKNPNRVNGVLIVQAGSYCTNLGLLRLTVAGDSVVKYNGELIELELSKTKPDDDVAVLVDSLEVVIQAEYGEVIGELAVDLPRSYYSTSPLGNWICDMLRNEFETDVAFVNTGGIRKDLSRGAIRKLDIIELLPFTNNAVTFKLSGAELLEISKMQVRGEALHTHGILDMSGISIKYEKRDANIENIRVFVNGLPLDSTRTYSAASIDYVTVSQPVQYFGFSLQFQENSGKLISDIVIEQIKNSIQTARPDTARRLMKVN